MRVVIRVALRSVLRMHQPQAISSITGTSTCVDISRYIHVGSAHSSPAVNKYGSLQLSKPLATANVVLSQNYHSSAVMLAQRRRRRGGGSDPSGGGDTADSDLFSHSARPIPVKNEEKFLMEAQRELDRIETAVKPMKACNDVFDVTRSANDDGPRLQIRLKGSDGTYTLQVDSRECSMNLSSPMSGVYTYVLCSKTSEWLGMDDGHVLEGMLTRDLIRQCNGIPKF